MTLLKLHARNCIYLLSDMLQRIVEDNKKIMRSIVHIMNLKCGRQNI